MKFWKLSSAVIALTFSTSVNAATVTQGYLTTDDDGSTNIITDSLNQVEYLRFDVLADLTHVETVQALGTQDGGGWTIATATDAIDFTRAFLGGTTYCAHDGTSVTISGCGTDTSWTDGMMGASFDTNLDYFWFLDNSGDADMIRINSSTGMVSISDYNIAGTDYYSAGGYPDLAISWLLTRPTAVPVPSAVWLFGSGLVGLIGVARRKTRS